MKLLINQLYIIVIILLNVNLLFPQNDVCLNIQNNPYPFSPALNAFSKYINILDCFHIYAEPAISDQKVLHAASIVAELLDNNEDGIVDDPLLEHQLRNSQAMMPLFSSEWSSAMDDVWNYYNGCTSAALFNNEIDPSQPGYWGDDASVEEILHTINHCILQGEDSL